MGLLNDQTLDESDLLASVEAGEGLTAGQPVIMGDGTSTGEHSRIESGSPDGSQTVTSTTWIAQKVVFEGHVRTIETIAFYHEQGAGQTWTVRVRSTLTGANLASGTFSPGVSSSGNTFRTVTLSAPLSVTPGTTYFLVFNASVSETPQGKLTSIYADGEAHRSTDSGATWAAHPTIADFFVSVAGGVTLSGKLYKAWDTLAARFIGFAVETKVSGQMTRVSPQPVVNQLTGLTAGSTYFLGTIFNRGTLTTTATARRVGIAVSSTRLIRDTV